MCWHIFLYVAARSVPKGGGVLAGAVTEKILPHILPKIDLFQVAIALKLTLTEADRAWVRHYGVQKMA